MAADLPPSPPLDEALRAIAMAEFAIGDFEDDPELVAITGFAGRLCGTPIALVSLVEQHRQVFLARSGLVARETPRSSSFCAFAMRESGIMEVLDPARDPRFADNPLVTGAPHIRYYAGAPLVTAAGVPLGALCVIDDKPRPPLDALQREGLRVLAAAVLRRLEAWRELRMAAAANAEQELRNRAIADAIPHMVWSARADGYSDYFSARWYDFTGLPPGSTDGSNWAAPLHPDDVPGATAAWAEAVAAGSFYETEYRMRTTEGDYRWVLARGLPIRDDDGTILRWIGTCTDIHDQKQAQVEREVLAQELSHRIKNIFSVIAGLVTFAARSRPAVAPLAADLRERIMALGRAHDFVRPHSARSRSPDLPQDSLHGLLAQIFAPYRDGDAARVRVDGIDVPIDDRSATPLALVFHELATNAAKYGALSVPSGTIALDIARVGDRVTLRWAERGGPAVSEPTGPSGFGSQLIELSAVRQLGGTFEREWQAEGLVATIALPEAALSRARG